MLNVLLKTKTTTHVWIFQHIGRSSKFYEWLFRFGIVESSENIQSVKTTRSKKNGKKNAEFNKDTKKYENPEFKWDFDVITNEDEQWNIYWEKLLLTLDNPKKK